MTTGRVDWGGLHNARDLGGLGGVIAPGALFRSPRLDGLDAHGWRQLVASGVTTIVDLRNDDEVLPLPLRPEHVRVVRAPVEDQGDASFMERWGALLGTPEYYADSLRRWPSLIAAAVGAVADAPRGGVLVHCAAGRDRTGLIVALVLRVAGAPVDAVLDDYELGVRETNAWLASNADRESHLAGAALARSIASKRHSLAEFLRATDVDGYLRAAGLDRQRLDRLRDRLVDTKIAGRAHSTGDSDVAATSLR